MIIFFAKAEHLMWTFGLSARFAIFVNKQRNLKKMWQFLNTINMYCLDKNMFVVG